MYNWNGLSLSLPNALTDESVLSFVDNPQAPTFGLTVAREMTDEPLPQYLREVITELEALIDGFKLIETSASDNEGIIDFQYPDEEGKQRQRQRYMRIKRELVVVTVSGAVNNFDPALDALKNTKISA